ncbi:hypothetical protein [Sporomusa sp.]|uniref:hypothetical protein n=1 Tax=Sporomusa sp. TaxID=2078658 RepID=UPI002C4F6EFF|nr:hypothetical protein [Sporomusa sp.]HWR06152.1 hypothetical protein [Sporomusa sp.]
MEITVKVSRTNIGLAAVSETGGAIGKTKGFARIICREDGSKKMAIYIPRPEEFETSGHAVLILKPRDCIIQVERSRSTSYLITVAQFTGEIDQDENAIFTVRYIKTGKRWDIQPPDHLLAAIDAAVAKSSQEDVQEAVWYERKQPPAIGAPVSLAAIRNQAQAPVPAYAHEYVPGFVAIDSVRQTAADEISVCLTNGVQLCVYIKACDPSNYKPGNTGTEG